MVVPRSLVGAVAFLVGLWLALAVLRPLVASGAELGLSGDVRGLTSLEGQLHESVNAWRAGRHLVPLERSRALDAVARRHSADMAQRGYLAHVSPDGLNPVDRIQAGGLHGFTLAGENVGMTNRPRPNHEVLHGWIASPAHYENLAAPAYNATGIGIARAADGTLYYTQLYLTFPRR